MASTTRAFFLKPTKLVPNSPQPLLYYPGALQTPADSHPAHINELFETSGWRTQWIFRYGPTQRAHYHSQIHECMAVLSGTATIRFGVADTSDDLAESTGGGAVEDGGLEINAQAGDVFVIPAGVSHKTYNTSPGAPFALLTPGRGRGIQADNVGEALSVLELGFTMMGSYPMNCGTWDFSVGGEDVGSFECSWSVAKPERDPVRGDAGDGLCGYWKALDSSRMDPRARL